MITGIFKIDLLIHDAFSLKDKRQVIKSIIERLKSRFNLSISEVGKNDIWNRSIIGISVVSNDAAHIDSMLSNIASFVEHDSRVEILDTFVDKLHYE